MAKKLPTLVKLDYFPPQGTKYEWHPPVLQHRPWSARIDFKGNSPRCCTMFVYRTTMGYSGYIDFCSIIGQRSTKRLSRHYKDPLRTLKLTEDLADRTVREENLPSWVPEALKLGWRPPVVHNVRY